MITLRLVLLISAFLCFFLNALNITTPRGNLIGAGLALCVLAVLIQ